MDNVCRTCHWFRPYRPTSQLLFRDLGSRDPQLEGEVRKMMQEERAKKDAEAMQKVELVRMEPPLPWPTRPTMSSYCGRHEDQQVYELHELKNAGGHCPDHRPHDGVRRACATCRHQRPAGGEARDAALFAATRQLAANDAVLGQSGSMNQLERHQANVSSRKATEAAVAYYAGKFIDDPPDYLPTCSLHSTASDFVPCCVQNPHDACRDWEPAGTGEADPRSALEALRLIEGTAVASSPAAGAPKGGR